MPLATAALGVYSGVWPGRLTRGPLTARLGVRRDTLPLEAAVRRRRDCCSGSGTLTSRARTHGAASKPRSSVMVCVVGCKSWLLCCTTGALGRPCPHRRRPRQ